MRKIASISALCIALLLTSFQASRSTAQSAVESFRPGVVLVGLRSSVSNARLTQLFIERDLQVEHTLSPLPVFSVRVPVGQEATIAKELRDTGQLTFAELDYAAHSTDILTPTDPGWPNQWYLRQINLPAAWGVAISGSTVTIAVVDSGIKLNHVDLIPNLWTNPGEIPGNFSDDDGNGYVDDVHGWHFYHAWNGSTYIPAQNADVADDFGHGTHVAGIAAAETNNGVGVAGIASQARILPVKVLNQYGNGWYSDIALGIIYAADNDARIINLSLGGAEDSQLLRDAVDYARQRGALVVAATGNTGGPVLYPAAYEPVLAVAATDTNDQHAGFSNYGSTVDIAAPGVDIYSTWPWVTGYFTKSGTSMAAPQVSGVAGLILSQQPFSSPDSLAGYITRTAVKIGGDAWNELTGWGRLDAYEAVRQSRAYACWLPLLRR